MDIIPQDDTPRKQCKNPHCQQWLPATPEFFYRQTARKDGLSSRCKTCLSGENRAYYAAHREEAREYHKKYYPAHQEERIQYSRNYRAEHPEEIKQSIAQYREEHREEILRAKAQYNAKHREERIRYARQWHEEHREEQRQYCAQYNAEHHEERIRYGRNRWVTHREKLSAISRRYRQTPRARLLRRACENARRARKIATAGTYTPQDIQNQYDRQKGKCYWCHIALRNYHVDHILPLSRGGTNWPDNLVIACPPCNIKRNNKLPHEFPEGGRLL